MQEAAYIYDELIDKYGSSPVLLNGLAVSKMHLAQWEEAETALKEAITKVQCVLDVFLLCVSGKLFVFWCVVWWALQGT